jgi:hypothetical protein
MPVDFMLEKMDSTEFILWSDFLELEPVPLSCAADDFRALLIAKAIGGVKADACVRDVFPWYAQAEIEQQQAAQEQMTEAEKKAADNAIMSRWVRMQNGK